MTYLSSALRITLILSLCALGACDSGEDPTPGDGSGVEAGSPDGSGEGSEVAGDDTGSTSPDGVDNGEVPPEPEPEVVCATAPEPTGSAIVGLVYDDTNLNDVSNEEMGFDDGVDSPLAQRQVNLLTYGGVEWTAETCTDGSYQFSDLADGVYLVEAATEGQQCQSRNCAQRLPSAVRAGGIKLVTMGDSVPVIGSQPTFPDRLAALLGGLATVNNRNIAVAGTTSKQWLPGTNFCENSLLPEVADADVLVISLGGNDILEYVNGLFSGGGALGGDLVGGAMDLVVEIVGNVMQTVNAVRAVNPTVDIVYCLYPNYGEATSTSPWNLVGGFLGKETMIELLDTARGAIPYGEGLILADMYAGFEGLPLDDYLYDSLHFNDAGATLYAEIIFQALGGAFFGESPLPPYGDSPLGAVHDFGLTP